MGEQGRVIHGLGPLDGIGERRQRDFRLAAIHLCPGQSEHSLDGVLRLIQPVTNRNSPPDGPLAETRIAGPALFVLNIGLSRDHPQDQRMVVAQSPGRQFVEVAEDHATQDRVDQVHAVQNLLADLDDDLVRQLVQIGKRGFRPIVGSDGFGPQSDGMGDARVAVLQKGCDGGIKQIEGIVGLLPTKEQIGQLFLTECVSDVLGAINRLTTLQVLPQHLFRVIELVGVLKRQTEVGLVRQAVRPGRVGFGNRSVAGRRTPRSPLGTGRAA